MANRTYKRVSRESLCLAVLGIKAMASVTILQLVTVILERSRHVIPFDHSKSSGAGPERLRRSFFRCGRVGWEVLHALRPEKFFVSGVK